MFKKMLLLAAIMVAIDAWAQLPHEVLLLINRQSPASMKVANAYAAARQIPACNIAYLDIPESIYGGEATVSPEQFTKLIWEPANAVVQERGLDPQILAWVYSVDFPIRVRTAQSDRRQMSVLGLTFTRNKVPGLSLVEDGKYFSKVFAGPNARLRFNRPSLSLRTYKVGLGDLDTIPDEFSGLKDGLGEQMPLPAMMLGYIGENGNDVQTVLETIRRGVESDFKGPHSGLYFVTSDDVRSTCREWQYSPAVKELQQRGIVANVTTNFPAGQKNVMGILMGAETVDPSQIGSFAPGAMAEHLTSWSAQFQKRQTKLTEWLKAGATASAGSVVEPYSNPNKFPGARFYVHYAAGCTMLESFYQSIACPLQILLLGDPLARPYAPVVSARLLGADRIKDDFNYVASASSRFSNMDYLYTFLLDGREIRAASADPSVRVRINNLADGYHELRAVASTATLPQFATWVDRSITVNKSGRSISILAQQIDKTGAHSHNVKVQIGGAQQPQKVRLMCGQLILDEQEYADEVTLVLDELLIGEGPTRIQAVAVYSDGMEVASPPLSIAIAYAP